MAYNIGSASECAPQATRSETLKDAIVRLDVSIARLTNLSGKVDYLSNAVSGSSPTSVGLGKVEIEGEPVSMMLLLESKQRRLNSVMDALEQSFGLLERGLVG